MGVLWLLLASACDVGEPVDGTPESEPTETVQLSAIAKQPRYAQIRDAARARGINNGYLLAGIANSETGLAMCWSEAPWACQGPSAPACGGGAIIAGAADGPCSHQQGGLGLFQFDAGTYAQTIGTYGTDVLTTAGQTSDAIDFVIRMVRDSAYTTDAETSDKARAWINRFDPGNATLVDQWIRTVIRYYNGCQPDWSCWNPRYSTYTDGYLLALREPGGLGFWNANAGTRCGNSPRVVGAIESKYLALGGCSSVLGAPFTDEQGTPDGVGRYSVFERGSIYWTAQGGAFEVHGQIRDAWSELGWEAGILGYPLSDEVPTPDGVGRYNVFERGSIYWTAATGAHAVYGRIRDAWAAAGWEAGALGYPIAGEVAVTGGRRSEFQNGSITWTQATDQTSITLTNGNPP